MPDEATTSMGTLMTVLDADAQRHNDQVQGAIATVQQLNKAVESVGARWQSLGQQVSGNLVSRVIGLAGISFSIGAAVREYVAFDRQTVLTQENLARMGGTVNS